MSNPPQWLPLPPYVRLHTYFTFVNLKNESERLCFKDLHVSGKQEEQNCWDNRRGKYGNGQRLYHFGGNRWLLFFTDSLEDDLSLSRYLRSLFVPGTPLNRELSPSLAALWLRINDHPIPHVLTLADLQGCSDGTSISHARLDRNWTPPVLPTSTDASTTNGSETSEPLQTHEAEQDEAPPPITPVELRGQDKCPLVYGKEKKRLTVAQYETVQALLQAPGPLTMEELETLSRHADARKVLYRLAKSDEDWKQAIIFPGKTGRGYGIRKLPPT